LGTASGIVADVRTVAELVTLGIELADMRLAD
jgi:hypothetical protein